MSHPIASGPDHWFALTGEMLYAALVRVEQGDRPEEVFAWLHDTCDREVAPDEFPEGVPQTR